ncbi:hypothetical protein [Lyngbya aestuarii]|uniref:hypothetical protein n=1 Tax=Lyngbya aestuarii TaxID=118322 RepID=UPI00403D9122
MLVVCLGLKVNRLQAEGFPPGKVKSGENNSIYLLDKQLRKLRPSTIQECPADLETLITLIVRDLPSYANRVIQKARRLDRTVDNFSYVIVAGNPVFEPLPLGPNQLPFNSEEAADESVRQVFLTTLERKYIGGQAVEFQNFHRLFLTQTSEGWRLAMIFTQIGSSEAGQPPTPPMESTNGVVGQAISTWLRDCRAGTVRSQ